MKYHRSHRYLLACCFALLTLCLALPTVADDRGEGPLDPSQPQGITVDEIIQKFAATEKQFKMARDQYTYRQDVLVQTLDGDTVNGDYHEVEDVLFDDKGNRIEHVVFAPQSTLVGLTMTKEDFDDIRRRMPFVLTSDEISEYQILYVGKQKEDELGTYVFDIAPKQDGEEQTLLSGPHLGGRSRLSDRENLRKERLLSIFRCRKETRRRGESISQVHHLARPDRRPVLVPRIYQGRRRVTLLHWRYPHRAEGEVYQLQALRREVKNHL